MGSGVKVELGGLAAPRLINDANGAPRQSPAEDLVSETEKHRGEVVQVPNRPKREGVWRQVRR